jgi:ketosteroid isomerase-like protein
MRLLAIGLFCSTALIGGALPATSPPLATPEEMVVLFHTMLQRGDRDAVLAYLRPKVSIFESGEVELSRDEYAAAHLAADIEFSKAVKEEVVAREAHQSGELAWVTTRSRFTGTFRGHRVETAGLETMVLELTGAGWRIAHIHWSSHPLSG